MPRPPRPAGGFALAALAPADLAPADLAPLALARRGARPC